MHVIMQQLPAAIEPILTPGIRRQTGLLMTKAGIATLCAARLIFVLGCALAAAKSDADTDEPWLGPYTGPTRSDIDASTLDGKVLCGYQGWFNTPGDGTTFGFTHWGQGLE